VSHGMFESAPPQSTRIYDPRLSVTQIVYGPIRDRVVIDGDIDLGSVEEVGDSFVKHVGRLAHRATMDIKNLADIQRKRFDEIIELALTSRPGADPSDVQKAEAAMAEIDKLRIEHREFQQQAAPIITGNQRQYRWPKGVIPYRIDANCPNKDLITAAIKHWHDKTTRIRLVPHDFDKKTDNWVFFVRAANCQSRIGKQPFPGVQTIELDDACREPQIIHEIGHAVGLFHEQGRPDRDNFLIVQNQFIQPKMRYNFNLVNKVDPKHPLVLLGEFDFDSIMLYPPQAYALKDKLALVRIKDKNDRNWGIYTPGVGGKTTVLSDWDIKGVEYMYPDPASP
jgi:Astacin (Peptidase family M12A)